MRRRWWVAGFLAMATVCGVALWAMFPYNLRAERAAARKAGIPLVHSEIPWTPVPKAQDATPWYDEFARRLRANDFTPAEDAAREKPTRMMTAHEKAVLRRAFATRKPMLDALHRASAMPAMGHLRPSSNAAVRFEGYSRAREAVKLLRDEGRMLTMDGRYAEAVRVQALGYNVVGHMYLGNSLIAYLMGAAIDAIADVGLMETLKAAGPDVKVAEAVRRAVLSAPKPNVADYLRAEVPDNMAYFHVMESWKNLQGEYDSSSAFLGDTQTVRAMSSPLSAAYLHWQRRLIVAADKPEDRRRAAMQAVADQVAAERLPGPALWFSKENMPVYASIGMRNDQRRARHRVLLAATHVMEYRARTGAWPARLEDAMPRPPVDPFGSRNR